MSADFSTSVFGVAEFRVGARRGSLAKQTQGADVGGVKRRWADHTIVLLQGLEPVHLIPRPPAFVPYPHESGPCE